MVTSYLEKKHFCSDLISQKPISSALFTTKTTLALSCRELIGCAPSALMRRIRLQQVHEVLWNHDLRHQLGRHAFQQAVEHFGFVNRNHFARAYRDLFADAPPATLLASR